MKKDTPNHPKMTALASILNIPRYSAVGILESLWHWAAQFAKPGDIGRWTDEQIASGIGYDGDAHKLIEALLQSGWIDTDEKYRLIIHDWYEHCEDFVHMSLARTVTFFADGHIPKMNRLSDKVKTILTEQFNAHSERTVSAQCATICALPEPMPLPVPEPMPMPIVQPLSASGEADDKKPTFSPDLLWKTYHEINDSFNKPLVSHRIFTKEFRNKARVRCTEFLQKPELFEIWCEAVRKACLLGKKWATFEFLCRNGTKYVEMADGGKYEFLREKTIPEIISEALGEENESN